MNQKLRTARSGIVILFAILSIVCLSVSLALSAHFAAYAEGETSGVSSELPVKDGNDEYLWKVYYTDYSKDSEGKEVATKVVVDLLDGQGLTYLNFDGLLTKGGSETNYFTPYRGDDVTLKIELNPDYEIEGQKLSALYDLEKAVYDDLTTVGESGGADSSTLMKTTVSVPSKQDGEAALVLAKEWVIAAFANEVVNADKLGISKSDAVNISNRSFALPAGYVDLIPALGSDIVYHFQGDNGYSQIIVIRNDNGVKSYLQADFFDNQYEVVEDSIVMDNDGKEYSGHDLINYIISRLSVGTYTLNVTALSVGDVNDTDVYYAANSVEYKFNVGPQSILGSTSNANSVTNFVELFGEIPNIHIDMEYTGDDSLVPTIELSIGDVKLTQGLDYTVVLGGYDVGMQNLRIIGNGNLSDEFVLENAARINPASNNWITLPNIVAWSYGDYNQAVNKIVGFPLYPTELTEDNINDIIFRIVSVDTNGAEHELTGLDAIHYVIEVGKNDVVQYLVSNETAALLAALHAGKYRLYASVYGSTIGDVTMDRNYRPIEEAFIDFDVRMGNNSWDSENGIPNVIAWTAGKYDPEINIISAIDHFGNDAIIIIRNGKGQMVYSNHPDHANQDYGVYGKDQAQVTKLLNKLKSGYYTLSAEVKGTDDYTGLKTLIDFEIARNGLPVWAVILIVVGSLAVVAVIFVILHEKGVLQMLTGKVIISMRTRANVDATIAAIRAAKVAREAEASIAAAKAREAEEAAKEKKD